MQQASIFLIVDLKIHPSRVGIKLAFFISYSEWVNFRSKLQVYIA